jgi:hypothetical protein
MATLTDINHVISPLVNALAASGPRINSKLFGQLKQIAASLNKPPESYQIFTPLAKRFVMQLRRSSPFGLNPSQHDQLRETKEEIIDLVPTFRTPPQGGVRWRDLFL